MANTIPTNTVATTIAQQIGNRALFMLGASNLGSDGDALSFKIKNSKMFTHIKIALNDMDTYDFTFYKISGYNLKNQVEVKGVYADMLHSSIEKHTGLYTKL